MSGAAGGEHLGRMPPVHAGVDDGAWICVSDNESESLGEEALDVSIDVATANLAGS